MKKTLKILMLIGIIALGINLTEVKAEEVTAPVTTAPQETTTAPETTTPAVTTPQETTTKVEQPTTVQPTTKPDVDTTGKNVKKGGYVKKTVTAYNLKLEKVTKVKKGIRYYVYKKCNNGYSLIQVGNQKNCQRKTWHRHGNICDGRDNLVCHSAEITGYQRQHRSHTGHDESGKNADIEGNSCAVNHLRENVLAHIVGSQNVLFAGRQIGRDHLFRVIRGNHRSENSDDQEKKNDQKACRSRRIQTNFLMHPEFPPH